MADETDGDLHPTDALAARRPLAPASWRSLFERAWPPETGRRAAVAAGALLALGAGVAGYALLRPPSAPPIELTLPVAGASPAGDAPGAVAGPSDTTGTTEVDTLFVHAAGAVAVPGVHELPAGCRVADLLAAAGGPTVEADLDRVNLAALLTDGERVWFPRIGEEVPVVSSGGGGGASGGGATGVPAGPLDVNTATAEELDSLPGIGPAIAAAIVEHRERNGPFASVDSLLDVPGIGDAKLEAIRDLVTVSR